MKFLKTVLISLCMLSSNAYADSQDKNIPSYELPSPAAATCFSLVGGYGLGHFYAKQPEAGIIHLTTQAVSMGIVYGGTFVMVDGLTDLGNARNRGKAYLARKKMNNGIAIISAGAAAYIFARIFDAATASDSARKTINQSSSRIVSNAYSSNSSYQTSSDYMTDYELDRELRRNKQLNSESKVVLETLVRVTGIESNPDDRLKSLTLIRDLLDDGVQPVSIVSTIKNSYSDSDTSIYDLLIKNYSF